MTKYEYKMDNKYKDRNRDELKGRKIAKLEAELKELSTPPAINK